jgi:UDP-N-acetylmuramate--alanine ligase
VSGEPGSLPAGEIVDLAIPRRIHVVGVGGSGMSAIARVLVSQGHRVSGSDLHPSATLDALRDAGVEVAVGHRPEQVAGAELVTRSTAIPDSNPEIEAARRTGIPVLSRADILAAIVATRRTVAVSGTHGKTTSSAMLALILVAAGWDPSYLVGGDIQGRASGAAWSGGPWLVVEADESDGTFLGLGAEVVVVTNVEPDHLDHYGGWPQLVDAFDRFLAGAAGARVVSADNETAARLAVRHGAVTFGTDERATYRMVDVELGGTSVAFSVALEERTLGRISLPSPGLHNARNACAAVVTALVMGAPFDAAERALASYQGVARRFQRRGEQRGVTFIDDYAHLPAEVAAAVAAARSGHWRRVLVAFQPHRYSRTAALWQDFADSFQGADTVAITDIYAAGEASRPGVSGKLIVEAVLDAHPEQHVAYLPRRVDLLSYLSRVLQPGDLCLTLGAGDLTTVPDELAAASGTSPR